MQKHNGLTSLRIQFFMLLYECSCKSSSCSLDRSNGSQGCCPGKVCTHTHRKCCHISFIVNWYLLTGPDSNESNRKVYQFEFDLFAGRTECVQCNGSAALGAVRLFAGTSGARQTRASRNKAVNMRRLVNNGRF